MICSPQRTPYHFKTSEVCPLLNVVYLFDSDRGQRVCDLCESSVRLEGLWPVWVKVPGHHGIWDPFTEPVLVAIAIPHVDHRDTPVCSTLRDCWFNFARASVRRYHSDMAWKCITRAYHLYRFRDPLHVQNKIGVAVSKVKAYPL